MPDLRPLRDTAMANEPDGTREDQAVRPMPTCQTNAHKTQGRPSEVKKRRAQMLSDMRDALRQLRKAPGFTATALITLALGIGATTAIFTLVHQVMLKSLPVAKPEELWRIGDKDRCCNWGGYTQGDEGNFSLFSWEAYKHFRDAYAGVYRPGGTAGGQCAAGRAPSGITGAGGHAQWGVCLRKFLQDDGRAAVDRPP